ncbi:MAG: hypothetical protein U9R08_03525 [Nanoarchaeota archaeon]|nr:hypothetical protein [Nanoarchaeota archaeon]
MGENDDVITANEMKVIIEFAESLSSGTSDCSNTEYKNETDKIIEYFNKKKRVAFMGPANVCMVVIEKMQTLHAIMSVVNIGSFFRGCDELTKIPTLEYHELKKNICCSKISSEYLQRAMLLTKVSHSLKIYCRKDYPITIEDEKHGIKVIIAPRVESE